MYPGWEIFIVGGVIIWLTVVTYLYIRQQQTFKKLFPEGDNGDIRNKFLQVLSELEEFRKQNNLVNKSLREIRKESLGFLQKVSLLRYNPYNDTGGDQSFTAVLLDNRLDGVLLSSMHSRSGTRVYAKKITKGKSDLKLSKEEEEALKEAISKENE